MHTELKSFADELAKIAEAQKSGYTGKKLTRAATAGLASSGAFGLGWGLGNLAADTVLPKALNKWLPKPTPKQLQKGMLLVGGLGVMASLANQLWKKKFRDYINQPEKKKGSSK